METMPERSRTPCSTTVKRLGGGSHSRKGLGSLPSNTNWPSELSPRLITQDFSGDMKSLEIKSSEESVGLNDQTNYPDYPTHISGSRTREKQPRDFGYKIEKEDPGEVGIISMPRGVIAEKKLKRLKELQRRREFTERYYSQEIRKLINEYYVTRNHGGGNSGDSKLKENDTIAVKGGQEQLVSSVVCSNTDKMISPPRTPRILKALEPCGTMTTTTRLDCGCMQETIRPIFTTSHGRVENRNCRHGQNPVPLKLQASEFNPQEHLSSSHFTSGTRRRIISGHNSLGIKHRPGIVQARNPECCGIDHFKRTQGSNSVLINKAGSRRPETASSSFIREHHQGRNISPLRKYSDSSTD